MVGRKAHASRPKQAVKCRKKEKETLPFVHYIWDSLTITEPVDVILYFVPVDSWCMWLMNLMAEEIHFSLNINDKQYNLFYYFYIVSPFELFPMQVCVLHSDRTSCWHISSKKP